MLGGPKTVPCQRIGTVRAGAGGDSSVGARIDRKCVIPLHRGLAGGTVEA